MKNSKRHTDPADCWRFELKSIEEAMTRYLPNNVNQNRLLCLINVKFSQN